MRRLSSMASQVVAGRSPFLSQRAAKELDEALMGPEYGFKLEQLMELAGLSVAAAVHSSYPPQSHPRALVVCGPGNNGGDGLVAARHLALFGYRPLVAYPVQPARYQHLVRQLETLDVPVVSAMPALGEPRPFDVLVDAVFGFSFTPGSVRPPYDAVLRQMAECGLPTVAVDVPSGWDVEKGPPDGGSVAVLRPDVLVSLSAPKEFARQFAGTHYLGGRFVPPALAAKFNLELPQFPGREQIVCISTK